MPDYPVTYPDFHDESPESHVRTSVRETSGPTNLTVGAVADGEYLKRDGSTVVGDTPAGGGVTNSAGANVLTKSDGTNLVASRITDDGDDINAIAEAVLLRLRGITGDALLGSLTGTRVHLSTDAKLIGGDTNETQVIVDDEEQTVEAYGNNGVKMRGFEFVKSGSTARIQFNGVTELWLPIKVRIGDAAGTAENTLLTIDDANHLITLTAPAGQITLSGETTIDDAATVTGSAEFQDNVTMSGLPTADPVVAGRLWNDAGTLKISVG